MTTVAHVQVRPLNQMGPVVQFEVDADDLGEVADLGGRLSDAVIEVLARAVQEATGGLVVPCGFCGQGMVMRLVPDGQLAKNERGLTCADEECRGSSEFWPVP